MEKRAKEARERGLQELKRLRTSGTAAREEHSSGDEEIISANPYKAYKDILAVHSSDEDFIDYVPSESERGSERVSPRGSERASKRQKLGTAVDAVGGKDEFFVNLIAQLDDEVVPMEAATDPIASEMDWDEPLPEYPTIPTIKESADYVNMTSEADPVSVMDVPAHKMEEMAIKSGEIPFYYIDAHERPNGTVFLFGLVREDNGVCKSACVTVRNVMRNVYLLPRETVGADEEPNNMELVNGEILELQKRFGIKSDTVSVRCVTRKYAFEVPGIPTEADWVKLTYPFAQPAFNTTTGRTFSHVFGAPTGALEMFIVKRRLMGPSWLSLRPSHHGKKGVSWCACEFEVDNAKDVTVMTDRAPPTPALTVLSLTIKTTPVDGQRHEIIAASGVVFKGVSVDSAADSSNTLTTSTTPAGAFSVVREDGPNQALPCPASTIQAAYGAKGKLEVAKNERALLSFLIAVIHRWDPDVIVGHEFLGVHLSVLVQRMRACQTPNWSRLGRLNWSQWPKMGQFGERLVLSGRLVCDTFLGAKEHVRSKNYLLPTLVDSQLGISLEGHTMDSIMYTPNNPINGQAIVQAVRAAESEAFLQAQLAFRLHLLSLSKQLTNIAGNLWNRTLTGARAERNEYLFLHEFHNLKYILPDKRTHKDEQHHEGDGDSDHEEEGKGRRKPAYSGGLVLEPKRGLYTDIVMLLDFNSLYPSLIQEFNICFTTVERSERDEIPALPNPSQPQGVLPRIIYNLVQRRRQVKAMMKNDRVSAQDKQQLNVRQTALKLTANSMYGCLGFTHSRFHARPLAALITAKGREVLQSTVDLARMHLDLDVIYGDTDSVMINTKLAAAEEARAVAGRLKKAVNERYKCLEIELDGLFTRLLLLKKKKYAAVIMHDDGRETLETKGLDMVRRDWCALSVEAGTFCLQQIMTTDAAVLPDLAGVIGKYLRELTVSLQNQQIPIESFVISKNLTKDPQLYADVKGQPHVAVALRQRERGLTVQAGMTVQYVICHKPATTSMSERAFGVDEVKRDPTLSIDRDWYTQQQLIPPLQRLCEFVPGVDGAFLAGCFGLDTKRYQVGSASGVEKYKNCLQLTLSCLSCEKEFVVSNFYSVKCTACNQTQSPIATHYQLLTKLRHLQAQAYEQQGECDECHTKSRTIRLYPQRCVNDDCSGTVTLRTTGRSVYQQLQFYFSLFEQSGEENSQDAANKALLEPCTAAIKRTMNASAYPIVSLRDLFQLYTL